MKKSYIKIIIFEFIFIMLLILFKYILNYFTTYLLFILLLIGILTFKVILGHEKSNYRNYKDIILTIIIFTISFIFLTYILALFVSFSKTENYLNLYGILSFILPCFLNIIVCEILRNSLLQKCEKSNLLIISSTVLFIIIDMISIINISTFSSIYNTFIFLAYHLVASIAKNILCSYISIKYGYKPSVVYRLITELYMFFVPLAPNFGDYINSLVRLLMPSILLYILAKKPKFERQREVYSYKNSKFQNIFTITGIFIIILLIYLTSGKFKYFVLAIGSDSMNPKIHKGDIVIVEKISDEELETLKIGQILVYEYGKTVIVHRIADIYKDKDEFVVYTKGDANDKKDNYPIYKDMVIGTTKTWIPLVGYPTIIINEIVKIKR